MRPIQSTNELLAHAIAIEREAAARYRELGERMQDLGNEDVAALFLQFALEEHRHEQALRRRAEGRTLPDICADEYAWLDRAGPETAARSLVLNMLTRHSVLEIALGAERRAQAFFEAASVSAPDRSVAELAAELAAEEREHVRRVQSVLAQVANPVIDWSAVFQ